MRVFNKLIPKIECKRGCSEGYIQDKYGNILQKNGIDLHCPCYFENKYLEANIGKSYWDLTIDNFDGHPGDLKTIKSYMNQIGEMYEKGWGLYIHGTNGAGKTLLSILLLKSVLERSNSITAMFAPFADLVILNSRIISGFYDEEASNAVDIIKNVDFLVLDDIGKEFDDGKDKTRATLNSILRYRDMWNKPTIYTANSPLEDLRNHYGDSNFSIMEGRSHIITMESEQDYRKAKKMKNNGKNSSSST